MTIIEVSRRFNIRPRKTKELLGISNSQNPLVDYPISQEDLMKLANFKARLKSANKRRIPKQNKKKKNTSLSTNPWNPNNYKHKKIHVIGIGKFHY
ncbi:MAG: hypothetical protein RIC06_15110 [Cyclobacteriaceae bacterium]